MTGPGVERKRRWVMTAEHAAHAAQNPPRPGYTCGPHAETYGGGCFNCGWKPEPSIAQARGEVRP